MLRRLSAILVIPAALTVMLGSPILLAAIFAL